ncbi:MAG: type II toxin-antitoxin system VapC family toxin [SAR202 cluster bacterium]|jgi:predicted nucleic acid-binding protein|nr:type II toxin-antitoxin system VapC family toxin [SAR202 cluster bacterium]MDP7105233.1 type II toxin-antitoxin system VapC family toxin [SAR202 cluster bacterium]HJO83221.1 type II toxin-antitoxin system VapC family toxin [SAR202 cluster bacterium]|tara:strand:+ start:9356 stop:9769 length:414 start_codon:yes stop_codon:yes gene_type:complete
MYMFDTDTLSQLTRLVPSSKLVAKFTDTPAEDQFTSAINVGEMIYGACRSPRRDNLLDRFETLLWSNLQILPFEVRAAMTYGNIRAELELLGMPLQDTDIRIAAVALVNDLTLVTGNVRHFARIPDLRIENWIADYA